MSMQELTAVISLWQPWASLIFAGRKKFETRSFRYPARLRGQRIAIHATAKFPPIRKLGEELHELCMDEFGCSYNYTVPQGAILGTVILGDCWETDSIALVLADSDDIITGDWSPGRFAWELSQPNKFGRPIPAKGKQGWWKSSLPREPAS